MPSSARQTDEPAPYAVQVSADYAAPHTLPSTVCLSGQDYADWYSAPYVCSAQRRNKW